MQKKTVAIIIDNKSRELLSATLIAMELAKRGIKVFMLPFYKMTAFVDLIHPDYILLPNLHKENDHIFERWADLGCSMGVLPSEGGALMGYMSGSQEMKHLSRSSKVQQRIAHYFAWGEYEFNTVKKILDSACVLVGQPRIDLLQHSFNHLLFNSSSQLQPPYPYVLITTNFPSINIRGSKGIKDQEAIDKLIKERVEIYLDHDENYWHDYNAERLNQYQKILEILKVLVKKHPNYQFVLRPHPFERIETYIEELQDVSTNLIISNKGGIELWLRNACCIIQLYSTSGVDATLVGVHAITPGWLPYQITTSFALESQEILNAINLHPQNIDELSDLVAEFYQQPQTENLTARQEEIWQQYLQPYYFRRDGKSFIRIADSIETHLQHLDLNLERMVQRKRAYRVETQKMPLSHIRYGLNLPFDLTIGNIQQHLRQGQSVADPKPYKQFTLSEVVANVDILNKHSAFLGHLFQVQPANNSDFLIPTIRQKKSIYTLEMI